MVRTKANTGGGMRVTAEKAPRKNFAGSSSHVDLGSPTSKKDKYAGGNPICPRPTPTWQKPIDSFFVAPPPTQKLGCKDADTSPENSKENINPSGSTDTTPGQHAGPSGQKDGNASVSPGPKQNGAVISMDDDISVLE